MRTFRNLTLILLLAAGATLCLATSKRLEGKKLQTPKVKNSSPLVLRKGKKDNPGGVAWVKENVNNQGCFADQRADFAMWILVQNPTKTAVLLSQKDSFVIINKKKYRLTRAMFRYEVNGKAEFVETLPPGKDGTLMVSASSILPKEHIKKVDRAVLKLITSQGRLTLSFDDIKKIPMERSH